MCDEYFELYPRMQLFHILGSILEPLLYSIYVNDMSGAISNKLLLYAYDSAILIADTYLSNIYTILRLRVNVWLTINFLCI